MNESGETNSWIWRIKGGRYLVWEIKNASTLINDPNCLSFCLLLISWRKIYTKNRRTTVIRQKSTISFLKVDLANKGKIFGLENFRKASTLINDANCLSFCLLLISRRKTHTKNRWSAVIRGKQLTALSFLYLLLPGSCCCSDCSAR